MAAAEPGDGAIGQLLAQQELDGSAEKLLREKPWITRVTEKTLNPVMGKSVVMYFEKEAA